MLEDLSAEKYRKNQTIDTTLQHRTMDSEPVNHSGKKKKAKSKTGRQGYRILSEHRKDAVSLAHIPQTSKTIGQSGTMAMCHQFHQEDGILRVGVRKTATYGLCTQLNEINVQQDQWKVKVHNDEIVIGRNCSSKGVNSESRQFSDALEILKLKRLSLQSLQFARKDDDTVELLPDIKFSGHGTRGTSSSPNSECSLRTKKQIEDSVYYKKVKDQYTYSSSRSSSPQPSNKIVVLRPSPKIMETPEHVTCGCSSLHYHQRFKDKGRNVKSAYLSFKEIKKRWKRAMGENQGKRRWISSIVSFHKIPTRKRILAQPGVKAIPGPCTRKHASSSAHTIKREESHEKRDIQSMNKPQIPTNDNTVCRKLEPSTGSYSKLYESDIFEEAKKHMLERVNNVDRSEIIENRQTRKTLGRILFSPEQDLYSAASPKWNMKYGSVSTETTRNDQASDGRVSPLMPILNFNVHPTHAPVGTRSSEDYSRILDTNDIGKQDDKFNFEVLSESINMDFNCAMHSPDTSTEGDGVNILASPSNDQITRSSFGASPSSPISQLQVFDNFKDGEEHQSPVSVLEPLIVEDADSPKSIIIQSSEGPLQHCRIDSKECAMVSPRDLEVTTIDWMNEDKDISAYMRAVLRAAGLNWDDPLLTSPSADEVLNTSFSYGEKLFGTKSDHEPELLFDCVNDVLLEVYEQHFGCSPWTSYLKPNYRAFPQEDHLVSEVVKDVKCLLLLQFVQPTLDQLVGHDIAKSASWLDMSLDTEEFVTQIAEDILEESIEDTILLFDV